MSTNLRILFFDIETAPLLGHFWRPYDGYISHPQLVHDSFLLTWAAKWRGAERVKSARLTSTEATAQDDARIVTQLADLVREADIVVAHNTNKFDVPMLNNRVLLLDQEPLGPTRTIDTLKWSKQNFRLAYNKLDYLAEALGLGNKLKTDFDLWKRAYHGDSKALKEMATYNKQDVVLLEGVFEKMLPHVRNAGRLVDASREMERACPFCGSDQLIIRKYYRTNASNFVQFQCKECRKYSRSRSAEKGFKMGVHPL